MRGMGTSIPSGHRPENEGVSVIFFSKFKHQKTTELLEIIWFLMQSSAINFHWVSQRGAVSDRHKLQNSGVFLLEDGRERVAHFRQGYSQINILRRFCRTRALSIDQIMKEKRLNLHSMVISSIEGIEESFEVVLVLGIYLLRYIGVELILTHACAQWEKIDRH